MRTKLTEAENLILGGHEAVARDLLMQLVKHNPDDILVYQDAVNILMLTDAYGDALRIIALYENRFGSWQGDFGKAELQGKLAQLTKLTTSTTQVFERQRFLQRGGPPAYWTLFPVRRISVSSTVLSITRRQITRTYQWASSIEVLTRNVQKMGAYGPAGGKRKWCNIHTPDGLSNVFDVSWENPDFAFPKRLLAALAAHTEIREGRWSEFRACLLGRW